MQREFYFDVKNSYASSGIGSALDIITDCTVPPVILCIGSDITSGDSLGPLVGTFLEEKGVGRNFIYGTLTRPVTAKEVKYMREYLANIHPGRKVIAVDAAVGREDEVGLIKLQADGLYPGIGVGKKMTKLGDCSIMGIVAPKTREPYRSLAATRLSLVYRLSHAISEGIRDYLSSFDRSIAL